MLHTALLRVKVRKDGSAGAKNTKVIGLGEYLRQLSGVNLITEQENVQEAPLFCYGAKFSEINFYVSLNLLHCQQYLHGYFFYALKLYLRRTLSFHISNETGTTMTRYDTGRTEIPFGPFDV